MREAGSRGRGRGRGAARARAPEVARPAWGSLALGVALWAGGASLGSAPSAWAQRDASGPGQAQVIEKVERGVFAAVEAGPVYLVAPDAAGDFGLAFGASVHLGYDLLPVLNVAVGASAVAAGGSERVAGVLVLRDRLYVTPSLRVQLALLTTDRHFLWVRAEGGFSYLETADAGGQLGPAFGGALGYEHFTVLRHFSIGAQAGLTAWLEPDTAFGIYLMPTLKYSF